MDIKNYLREKRELIDSFLEPYFDSCVSPFVLKSAMSYSIFAGGKRLRPILALASYEACGGKAEDIVPFASALELIHTYSLIHDDLPSMDNDDLRRGKPTNHKVFGEGMAILAGDGLLTEAFYLLSRQFSSKARVGKSAVVRMIRDVAMAAGPYGMVGGQAEDILCENKDADSDDLAFIHTHKTGALIAASVRMGGILANTEKKKFRALTRYGENIGVAFQIIDDILDVGGNTIELGKTTGSDERKKKLTYPAVYGIELSTRKAHELIDEGIGALECFSEKAEPLKQIALYIAKRKS